MTSTSVRAGLCALFAALAWVGCGGDDSGASGAGGAAGMGGAGGAAGMAGDGGGVGGGGAGGMGGAGAGGMGATGVPGCEVAVAGTPADLHAAALMALTASCSFGSCHDASSHRANLVIVEGDNLMTKLTDVPSCQNTTMSLVKSGGGDAALQGSWLWQKLTAPDDSSFNLITQAAWGVPVETCNQLTAGTFGARMPMGGIDLSETRLATVRNWICAGATGP